MRFYSKGTDCTYLAGFHAVMPDDVVPISEARYQEVIGSPAPGKVRSIDADGLPILIDSPEQGLDELSSAEREWRDAEIVRVIWLRDRHRDEVEMGAETTISAEQYVELLAYIKALRDWPATTEFPAEESRPVVPEWVTSQAP